MYPPQNPQQNQFQQIPLTNTYERLKSQFDRTETLAHVMGLFAILSYINAVLFFAGGLVLGMGTIKSGGFTLIIGGIVSSFLCVVVGILLNGIGAIARSIFDISLSSSGLCDEDKESFYK